MKRARRRRHRRRGRVRHRARERARARRQPRRAVVARCRTSSTSINTKRGVPALAERAAATAARGDRRSAPARAEARFLVMAVSSTDVRERARELGAVLDGSHIVVHAIGALATPTNERVSEVMQLGLPTLKIGVLAGPALPQDLAEGEFSSMVVASAFDEVVAEARRLLNAPPVLRVYGSKDLAGVELASALSGAYTVALGLCDGLGMGAGPRAVLDHARGRRGVAARRRGGRRRRRRSRACRASATCSCARATTSADYQLGRRLADGVMTADAERTEGARAALAGAELAKQLKARMPVLTGVAAVLVGQGRGARGRDADRRLRSRPKNEARRAAARARCVGWPRVDPRAPAPPRDCRTAGVSISIYDCVRRVVDDRRWSPPPATTLELDQRRSGRRARSRCDDRARDLARSAQCRRSAPRRAARPAGRVVRCDDHRRAGPPPRAHALRVARAALSRAARRPRDRRTRDACARRSRSTRRRGGGRAESRCSTARPAAITSPRESRAAPSRSTARPPMLAYRRATSPPAAPDLRRRRARRRAAERCRVGPRVADGRVGVARARGRDARARCGARPRPAIATSSWRPSAGVVDRSGCCACRCGPTTDLRGARQRFVDLSDGAGSPSASSSVSTNAGAAPREVWADEHLRPARRRRIERAWPERAGRSTATVVRAKLVVKPGARRAHRLHDRVRLLSRPGRENVYAFTAPCVAGNTRMT